MSKEKQPAAVPSETSVDAVVPAKITFKTVKSVTRTVRKLEKNVVAYLRIDGKITVGKTLKAKPGEEARKPAMTADVTDMETGEVHVLLCNAVLMSELQGSYPEEQYVGKVFAITNQGKLPGRDYFTYSIAEVEVSK